MLPWCHLTERLVRDIPSIISPLPLLAFPIVNASDPNIESFWLFTMYQKLSQSPILMLDWLGQPAITILTLEMGIEPIDTFR